MKKYKLYIMESTTGIILNNNFTYHLDSSNTKPYLEFKEKEKALEYILNSYKANVSFELFNDLNELVFERSNPLIELFKRNKKP